MPFVKASPSAPLLSGCSAGSPWESLSKNLPCLWKSLVLFKWCLSAKHYYPWANKWLSNNSDWVEAWIVEIAFKEIIPASWACGIHAVIFILNLAFFLWLFWVHLNQIYKKKLLVFFYLFCFVFLQKLSLALPFHASFHPELWGHSWALVRSPTPTLEIFRTWTKKAPGLTAMPSQLEISAISRCILFVSIREKVSAKTPALQYTRVSLCPFEDRAVDPLCCFT